MISKTTSRPSLFFQSSPSKENPLPRRIRRLVRILEMNKVLDVLVREHRRFLLVGRADKRVGRGKHEIAC